MAPVRPWVVLVLVGCTAIALASLPPRGKTPSGRPQVFDGRVPERTPARQRAQALAEEWRATEGALRLLETRARVQARWSRSSGDVSGATVVLTSDTAISPSVVRMVESAMDTAWRQLGLAETKVRVVVVLELWHPPVTGANPAPNQDQVTYLEPDSTDRTTCIAFVPAGVYWTRFMLGERIREAPRFGRFEQWLQASLGPCAFYAAYGTPSRPVRRWLTARKWDVALYLGSHGIQGERFSSVDLMGNPRFSWYWDAMYSFPPATVACLAGRTSGCRAAVLDGTETESRSSGPQIVRLERRWWRVQRLLPGERYLSDVARAVGRERFQRFWSSSLPVDTALAAALQQPVGEWTEQWERRFVPRIRLGATAPLGAAVLALLLAAVAVTIVARSARRRQVR